MAQRKSNEQTYFRPAKGILEERWMVSVLMLERVYPTIRTHIGFALASRLLDR